MRLNTIPSSYTVERTTTSELVPRPLRNQDVRQASSGQGALIEVGQSSLASLHTTAVESFMHATWRLSVNVRLTFKQSRPFEINALSNEKVQADRSKREVIGFNLTLMSVKFNG